MVRVLTKAVQACCAALVAALLVAPAAHASGDACPPAQPPGEAQTVNAPQALGQTFTLASERIVSAVHPVVGDLMLGNATVRITSTAMSGGVAVPSTVLAAVQVPLPADPTSVDAVLPAPLRLGAGTYAIVVDPPGAESTVAWTRCADQSAAGAAVRTSTTWVPLPDTRLAFVVDSSEPDRTPPVTTIDAAPPAWTNAAEVSISFSANEPSTFTCIADGLATGCSSPLVLAPGEGAHTVVVVATDASGNTDPTGAATSFTVDRTAPVLDLPEPVEGFATSADGAVVDYDAGAFDALDPNPQTVCAPASGSLFAIGATTVSCTATDAAGNVAAGAFPVSVAADPGQAELTVRWDPTSRRIELAEPGGGTVEVTDTEIFTRRGPHRTIFDHKMAHQFRYRSFESSLQLVGVQYDDASPRWMRRTAYTVRGETFRGGTIKNAWLFASGKDKGIIVCFKRDSSTSTGTSRIMFTYANGQRPRIETRRGLWVPKLVTRAGVATVDLVAGVATSGGGAVSATGHDPDALGDVLERLVVMDADLTPLQRDNPLAP
jgi:hypothetical protein